MHGHGIVLLAEPLICQRDVDRTRLLLAMAEGFFENQVQEAHEATLDVARLFRLVLLESDKHTAADTPVSGGRNRSGCPYTSSALSISCRCEFCSVAINLNCATVRPLDWNPAGSPRPASSSRDASCHQHTDSYQVSPSSVSGANLDDANDLGRCRRDRGHFGLAHHLAGCRDVCCQSRHLIDALVIDAARQEF